MKLKYSILYLNDVRLSRSQIHKMRGYVGNLFAEHDLIHNHDPETGKLIYRYPMIQFKMIENTPAIIAITDRAVKIFTELFMKLDQIVINGREIPVFERNLDISDVEFGYSNETYMYEFTSPWVGLNQKNFRKFENAGKDEKYRILKSALIGNILAASKGLNVWLSAEQRISAEANLKNNSVMLKGNHVCGFTGVFKTNFVIPDHLGIGKSVSRGYGMVRRIL